MELLLCSITTYHYIVANHCYMLLLNHTENLSISRLNYFIKIAKLYIYIILVKIRNIYAKYSQCESMHFIVLKSKSQPL